LSIDSDVFKVRRSVDAILRNQSKNGAIIASPDFAEYEFCWLRDSSFNAYALDCAGEHAAASKYHLWVNRAVSGIAQTIDDVIDAHQRGEALSPLEMPPARFALDGTVVVDDWPNFQIDGYGTWLWSLGQHLELTGRSEVPEEYVDSVHRVARYLATFAFSPCYDVWEENGDAQHTSTLASVYGGLVAAGRMLGDESYFDRAQRVKINLKQGADRHGYFVKSSASDDVDASCLWLTTPFGVVDSDDEHFAATVALIEERLTLNGGIRRYSTDVYFGSGAWPVLTGSLGWHYANAGDIDSAERCREWIASRFDEDGDLGEQYGGEVRDPRHYDEWVERWGPPAKNLMWSHAMYVLLCRAIEDLRHDPVEISQIRDDESHEGAS
jgi:GH15 family glucan-1,4-alpha-glucosidase